MAAEVFNIAKGRFVEWQHRVNDNDPTNAAWIVTLLKASETNATLRDYDDLSTLLAAAGNTEADFTNYGRKTLTDTDVAAPTVDDTNDRTDIDFPDQTWTSAGGTTDNTLATALANYDSDTTGGTDANIIPGMLYDAVETTNGSDLVLSFHADGAGRAA